MGFLYNFYGVMGFLWDFSWISMGILCGFDEISTAFLWCCYGIPMGFLWDFFGGSKRFQ